MPVSMKEGYAEWVTGCRIGDIDSSDGLTSVGLEKMGKLFYVLCLVCEQSFSH